MAKLDVKCIKGPFWLPDVDPEADEHFGYECTVNGTKIVIGEEPADDFRYIHEWDGEAFRLYRQYRDKILSLADRAIKEWESHQKFFQATSEFPRLPVPARQWRFALP
jgi:hypothetical protein